MSLRKTGINSPRTLTKLKWADLYDAATEAEISGKYYLALVLWKQASVVATLGINRKYAYAKSVACLKQINEIHRDNRGSIR